MKKRNTASYNILVTAGPTIEPIDPVRFISNYSTGTMGYAIAKEAKEKGHKVCLITGPVHIDPPPGVDLVKVNTSNEMQKQIKTKLS